MELRQKKIAVLGLGREAKALAKYFNKTRIDAEFLDENPNADDTDIVSLGFRVVKKTGAFASLNNYNIVFRSPGISMNHPALKPVRLKLTSLTKLFFELWPGKIIGVTGTKGKGTTASIIKSILSEANIPSVLLGNIGEVDLNIIEQYQKNAVAVYEMSSFQLEGLGVSPDVAVVLDVSSEHLDYHKTTQNYQNAKLDIVRHQKPDNWLITTCQNPIFEKVIGASKAQKIGVSLCDPCLKHSVWWQGEVLHETVSNSGADIVRLNDLQVVGIHNMVNAAAAAAAALSLGVDTDQIRQGIKGFSGLPYRMQNIGTFGGLTFYNDSASTNPQTVLAATKAIGGDKVLIIGGRNKGLDYHEMVIKINRDNDIKHVLVYGELTKEIEEIVEGPHFAKGYEGLSRSRSTNQGKNGYNKFVMVQNLDEAVEKVVELAHKNASVIFSPGAASFDQFPNYEVRGQTFNKIVYGLNHR